MLSPLSLWLAEDTDSWTAATLNPFLYIRPKMGPYGEQIFDKPRLAHHLFCWEWVRLQSQEDSREPTYFPFIRTRTHAMLHFWHDPASVQSGALKVESAIPILYTFFVKENCTSLTIAPHLNSANCTSRFSTCLFTINKSSQSTCCFRNPDKRGVFWLAVGLNY